jgi:sulfite reductase (NADPH) flavoprotein alpha-component
MYTRSHPYLSRIVQRELLTGKGSSKKTYHLVLDVAGWESGYKVGDSVGTLPQNDPAEVDLILDLLSSDGTDLILDSRANERISLREFISFRANLNRVSRPFLALLAEKGETSDSAMVKDVLSKAPFTPEEFAKVAMPLLPRFYSIANSPRVFPGEIHLLVNCLEYHENGQTRKGVGSHFLCDVAEIGSTPVPIYVQPSHHFTIPQDSACPIIFVGPGTGVAPFRAFLQERIALKAPGRNWLFFGERNRNEDFYYESFWTDLEKQGLLRLDLAFSRDGKEKCYVQHKMWERRKSLWEWLSQGALCYVCGDAEKMAKDVDGMLHRIIEEEGSFSKNDAMAYVKKMRAEKRYLLDVY